MRPLHRHLAIAASVAALFGAAVASPSASASDSQLVAVYPDGCLAGCAPGYAGFDVLYYCYSDGTCTSDLGFDGL